MNKEVPNGTQSNNEEVDLIKLLDYFKGGIKSVFRRIWKGIEIILYFIALLKKNWIIVAGLTVLGFAYGFYLHSFSGKDTLNYEMVVKSNSISNIELYALASEISNLESSGIQSDEADLIQKTGIQSMTIEPIEREEDIVNSYFEQIETTSLRGDETDTLYYQAFELKAHKDKMDDEDYSFQKVKLKVKEGTSPIRVQKELLNYLNNLPGIKREQEIRLAILTNYEKSLKQNIDNIDSIMISRAALNNNSGPSGTEQLLVNTASRGNVEADLLKYSELFIRKLYGTQKMISNYQKGINVVSNLRLINDNTIFDNPIIRLGLFGFILSSLFVVLIQFNKFLSRYQTK